MVTCCLRILSHTNQDFFNRKLQKVPDVPDVPNCELFTKGVNHYSS